MVHVALLWFNCLCLNEFYLDNEDCILKKIFGIILYVKIYWLQVLIFLSLLKDEVKDLSSSKLVVVILGVTYAAMPQRTIIP